MNKKESKSKKLSVKEEEGIKDSKQRRDETMNCTTYGLSLSFLKFLNIDLPLVNIVFAANFGTATTESCLKDVFSLAGHVIDVEIFRDKEGNSRGYGIVEYEHPLEAVQAISMLHNQMYNDRLLAVRMDRCNRKRTRRTRLPSGLKSVGMGLAIDGGPLRDFRFLKEENSSHLINSVSHLNPLASDTLNSTFVTNQLSSSLGGLLDNFSGGRPGANHLESLSNNLATLGLSCQNNAPPNSYGAMSVASAGPYSGSVTSGTGLRNNFVQGSNNRGGILGNIVHIGNLPLDYNSEKLRKLCWTFGDVQVAEMRSQGTGIVKFKDDIEAQRAVEMLDQQPLEGWILIAKVL